jgi:pimeloyl-ACP methyl ester carboxylesterase
MADLEVREGSFRGGLPYLAVGAGPPLVYLCGTAINHRNPRPGLERWFALATITPFARAGFEVFFTNRWPRMPVDITFAEVAAGHAEAILDHFGEPVDVLGHSTGGSLLLHLIADRPDVVRKAVVAAAAYRLGPAAKRSQLRMLADLEQTGRFRGDTLAAGLDGMVRQSWVRSVLTPPLRLIARGVRVEHPPDAIAMLRAEDAFDVRDRLPDIPTETLVICGAQDAYWTLDMFAETAYRMPRGRLIMYRRRGHALVTAPEFFRDVTAFLRE